MASDGAGAAAITFIIIFLLLWSLIPVLITMNIGSSKGLDTGMALVLGFFLGWLGVIIVLVMPYKPVEYGGGMRRRSPGYGTGRPRSRRRPRQIQPRRDDVEQIPGVSTLLPQDLPTWCARCGRGVRPGDRFCPACGGAL